MHDDNFSITNTTKGKLLRLPFAVMKNAVLGPKYSLSLVIVDDATSRTLNKQFREKNKPTDILSFPLSKIEGEIFLNLKQCKIKAPLFERTYENYLAFVFIHGLVHLKGFDHGSRMESIEEKFRAQFGV